ncbi:hypothetical protein L210DRAFT_3538265 [Boletus edulis BED1]|uniref:superoxide dismutase n=1 Tax=Boletus edulis BED1 TaxID=1328754 RepID=A0AAD4BD10_BOLED|nr:hypothetical protein L210DRAFT_3576033 [Boletus edulis BED1]KAF8423429.1 hypothetical protein L210DRAFT_3570236 [Boletus edulis BED1]KAF8423436.1 hypothetical protein L210DRAFT_3570251 [Boletus edulis BED1]KAF8423461.1 hypothetical protein L210DRAFT_3570285 [Boletus edulis BED1]KAF8440767.1 hypothetical protein L210DRAFT_3538265 [Boletus edulis BED1]
MRLHHMKHHQGYVNALDAAETSYVKAATRIALQAVLKSNGGVKCRLGDVRVHAHFTHGAWQGRFHLRLRVLSYVFSHPVFGLLSSIRITDVRSDCL